MILNYPLEVKIIYFFYISSSIDDHVKNHLNILQDAEFIFSNFLHV